MTATTVDLVKYHGLGNDFFVALRGEEWVEVGAGLARAVCDRHLGFGADGLLLLLASHQPGTQVRMRLHNADGSVAEMSGNGIRCFVQACLDGGVLGPGRVSIETDAGQRTVEAGATDEEGIAQISVDMGSLVFDALPVLGGVPGEAVTVVVGNPHLVVATDERDIAAWGPKLEHPYLTGPHWWHQRRVRDHARAGRRRDARMGARGGGHASLRYWRGRGRRCGRSLGLGPVRSGHDSPAGRHGPGRARWRPCDLDRPIPKNWVVRLRVVPIRS